MSMTAAQYRALDKPAKRSKYGNKKVVVDGITFDSDLEAKRWQHLRIRQRLGEIRNLRRQVRFRLEVNGVHVCDYIADHVYEMSDGEGVVEDAKGVLTKDFVIKRKLMRACLGIDILLVGKERKASKRKPPQRSRAAAGRRVRT